MATVTVSLDHFTLSSSWQAWLEMGETQYSTPTTGSIKKVLDLIAIPGGARIKSARISGQTDGQGMSYASVNGVKKSVTNTFDADVSEWLTGVVSFSTLTVTFSFKAFGGTGATGTQTRSASFNSFALTVEYEPQTQTGGDGARTMVKDAPICIYAQDATDFTGNGLGPLCPSKCDVHEVLNGVYELTLEHPIDDGGKWARIVTGRIVRAPVPMDTTPSVTAYDGAATQIYTANEDIKLLQKASAGARKIASIKAGDELVYIETTDETYSRVVTGKGTKGYVQTAKITYARTDAGTPYELIAAKAVRDQPFRIYRVENSMTGVKAYARHIYYDLANLLLGDCATDNATGQATIAAINNAIRGGSDYNITCAMAGNGGALDLGGKNPVDALMGDDGVLSAYSAEMVRDWYDVYIVERVGHDGDAVIAQRKNLIGLTIDESDEDIITRIVPVGEDKDGEKLYLPDTEYIDSDHIGDYPMPIWSEMTVRDAKEVAKGSDTRTKAECYTLMRAAAQAEFDAGCDLPDMTIDIDFVAIKDLEKYKDLASLKDANIYLGDGVRVVCARTGTNLIARLTEYTYDCIARKYTSVKLGTVTDTLTSVSISGKQLPGGVITGSKVARGAVGESAIAADAIAARHIQAEAITADAIAASTITAAKLAAGAVTADSIAANAVTAGKIAAGAVTADKLSASSVTADKLAANAVTADKIAAGAISAGSAAIANGAIGTAQIADAAITNAKVSDLSADKITTGTLDASVVTVNNLTADNITTGTLNGQRIPVLGTDKLADGAVTGVKVANGAISAAKMDNSTCTAVNLSDTRPGGNTPTSDYEGIIWLNRTASPPVLERCEATQDSAGATTYNWVVLNDKAALSDAVASLNQSTAQLVNDGASLRALVTAAQGDADTLKTRMTAVETDAQGIHASVTAIDETLADDGSIGATVRAVQQNFDFGTDGLTIGKTGDAFKSRLSGEKLSFTENGEEVAYISNDTLHTHNASVDNDLQIGGFTFLSTSGGLGLAWRGN